METGKLIRELIDKSGVSEKTTKEALNDYYERLVDVVDKLADAVWDGISKEAQELHNKGMDASSNQVSIVDVYGVDIGDTPKDEVVGEKKTKSVGKKKVVITKSKLKAVVKEKPESKKKIEVPESKKLESKSKKSGSKKSQKLVEKKVQKKTLPKQVGSNTKQVNKVVVPPPKQKPVVAPKIRVAVPKIIELTCENPAIFKKEIIAILADGGRTVSKSTLQVVSYVCRKTLEHLQDAGRLK